MGNVVACSGSGGGTGPTDAPTDMRVTDAPKQDRDVRPDQEPPDALADAQPDAQPDVRPDVQSDTQPDEGAPDLLRDAVADALPDMDCSPRGDGGEACCEPIPRECCDVGGGFSWNEAGNCCFTCVVGPLVPPAMIG